MVRAARAHLMIVVTTTVLAVIAGLIALTPTPAHAAMPAFYDVPSPLPSAPAGTLIKSEPLETTAAGAGYRVMFHSETIQGADLAETGTIYVPNAPAPPGGRPVLTLGHGTTGTADQCAPSLTGYGSIVDPLLEAGFIVAATDFEGLGGPGVHPYLLGESEGRGVLDAARVALTYPGADARNDVLILGVSQGGHAALFANELAPTYAPDLHVLGTVAEAPASHNELMYVGAKFQKFAAAVTIAMGKGFIDNYPGLDPHDIYTDAAIARMPLLDQLCMGEFLDAVSDLGGATILKADPATVPAWNAVVQASEPGHRVGGAPVFHVHGTADDTVPYPWSVMLARELCAIGQVEEFRSYPGVGHAPVVDASMNDVLAWMANRLAGLPARTVCPPDVTGVSPGHGPSVGGYPVTVTGSGFTGAEHIEFGSTPAPTFSVLDDSHISVVVPPLAAGPWNVHVTGNAGYNAIGPGSAFRADAVTPGVAYSAMTAPLRLLDSRSGTGWSGPLVAGYPRALSIPAAVPTDAAAVVLNVTAVDSTLPTFISAFPTTFPPSGVPNSSVLNVDDAAPKANLVTVKVGYGDAVSFATALGKTDLVVDLVGYYRGAATQGGTYTAVTPFRALDSRTATGGWSGPLGAGDAAVRTVRVAGGATAIPADAGPIIVNITATNATSGSFIEAWNGSGPRPVASSVNFAAGETVANQAIVVAQDGLISLYNDQGTTDVVVDVVGYFRTNDPAGALFHAVAPTRVLDDRVGVGATGPWGPGVTRTVAVTGTTAVPPGATGVVLNATATNATLPSYLTLFPASAALPSTSSLNFGAHQTIANAGVVGLSPDGRMSIFNLQGAVDVVGDVQGYFAPY